MTIYTDVSLVNPKDSPCQYNAQPGQFFVQRHGKETLMCTDCVEARTVRADSADNILAEPLLSVGAGRVYIAD